MTHCRRIQVGTWSQNKNLIFWWSILQGLSQQSSNYIANVIFEMDAETMEIWWVGPSPFWGLPLFSSGDSPPSPSTNISRLLGHSSFINPPDNLIRTSNSFCVRQKIHWLSWAFLFLPLWIFRFLFEVIIICISDNFDFFGPIVIFKETFQTLSKVHRYTQKYDFRGKHSVSWFAVEVCTVACDMCGLPNQIPTGK